MGSLEKGESLKSIGRLFDRPSSSIFNILAPTGGIRPPIRKRSKRVLTQSEREEISRGTVADLSAWERAHRPKRCKLACNRPLSQTVATKLQLNWSPEQIAGWLKIEFPNDGNNRVSHETIYCSLFVQTRGVLKKELQQYLRSQRAIRRSKHASLKRDGLGQITNAVSISERPASVEDRAVPGHWEGDLIAGSNNSYIATLVERHTRYVMLAKVKNKDTESVVSALIKQSKKLPDELYKSLTWDRGKELADHERFTLETDINVYSCESSQPMATRIKRKY